MVSAIYTIRRAFQLAYQTPTKLTFGQPENLIPFRQYMDEGRFLIFNLAGLPERSRRIIGALLMVMMEQAAMSRFNVLDKAKRVQHTTICDEWPTFAATEKTMQEVLSQGRKFGYNLYLACQSVGQIDQRRLSYAFDNCRLKVFFELGATSSEASARQIGDFDPYAIKEPESPGGTDLRSPTEHRQYLPLSDQIRLWTNELEGLDNRWCYAKVGTKKSVKIRTLNVPDVECRQDELDEVIDTYHTVYHRSHSEAEKKIAEFKVEGLPLRDGATSEVFTSALDWEADDCEKSIT